MAGNLTVTKSNILVEASYRLTLEEQRLILACIGQLDGRKSVPDDIVITAIDYADIFDLSQKISYHQLATAAKRLYVRDVRIDNLAAKQQTHLRWVQDITYHPGEGKITLSFANKVKPYLGELKNQFTSYKLQLVAKIKSTYAIRIYELLQQYQSTGIRFIDVEDLRDYLGLLDKYRSFKQLKQSVLNRSIDELNKKTNLVINVETLKKGRTIYALKFTFHAKKPKIIKKKPSKKPKTPIEYAALYPKKTRGKTTAEVIEMMRNEK